MTSLVSYTPEAEIRAGDPRREIVTGAAIAFFFFVVLLGAAALIPLNAGVHAQGSIAVLGNRQTVQHKEGGIITAIHVRDGDHVRAGEVLIELAAPELQAEERSLTSDYLSLLAARARLLAERAGQRNFATPPEFASLPAADRELADQALELQRSQMHARASSLTAQQSVWHQRALELGEQQSGYSKQRGLLQEQQRLIADELQSLRQLQQKGFASTNRIRALERSEAELKAQEAQMIAEYARAGEGMGESRMQSLTLTRTTIEQIASDLRDTQAKLSEVVPKLVSAREQLQHALVRAPATGRVVGLSVFTIGGVVAAGQTLMEVVPENKMLVVQAQVQPNDADDVYAGQAAQIRFASDRDRSLPLLDGRVRTISADSFTDEETGRSYFRTEIEVPPSELEQVRELLGRGELRPGLPVEAILAVRKRTALQYLVGPLVGTVLQRN
jgi:HlyD family type I secretion membrane fusion protein